MGVRQKSIVPAHSRTPDLVGAGSTGLLALGLRIILYRLR